MEQQLQNTIQNLENLNSNLLQNKQQTIDNVVSGNNLTQATKVQDQISRSTEIVTSLESGGGSMTSSTKSIDAEKINFSKPIPLKSCNTSSTTTLTAQQSSSHNVSITAGLFGWFSENEFLNKVAEKAMSSVDSVITTLDPGMKEVLCKLLHVQKNVCKSNLCVCMIFLAPFQSNRCRWWYSRVDCQCKWSDHHQCSRCFSGRIQKSHRQRNWISITTCRSIGRRTFG